MRLKSYFAESVEAAMEQARKELGPEAMLVYSREALPEARYLGSYEVVFSQPAKAAGESSRETAPPRKPVRPEPGGAEGPSVAKLSREVARLREQMERMAASAVRARPPADAGWHPTSVAEVLGRLSEAGVAAEITEEVAGRLRVRPEMEALARDGNVAAMRELVRAELGSMFTVDARLGLEDGASKVVALVGPPGSGKTTTLVKLAVSYGLKSRRPVQLISMDTWRVGGAEQLRSYAAILGVGFEALETPGALAQALEAHRSKGLVLIDTPGQSAQDMDAGEDLATFLKSSWEVDTHLTLTASMKSADLRRAVDRYERFRPAKLLFTRVDETSSFGTILNEAVRTGKPVSFLANGQQIPEDLAEASREDILDLVLSNWTDGAESGDGSEDEPMPSTRSGRAAAA
jgi:flagellar biosynthesis protein FlhF